MIAQLNACIVSDELAAQTCKCHEKILVDIVREYGTVVHPSVYAYDSRDHRQCEGVEVFESGQHSGPYVPYTLSQHLQLCALTSWIYFATSAPIHGRGLRSLIPLPFIRSSPLLPVHRRLSRGHGPSRRGKALHDPSPKPLNVYINRSPSRYIRGGLSMRTFTQGQAM